MCLLYVLRVHDSSIPTNTKMKCNAQMQYYFTEICIIKRNKKLTWVFSDLVCIYLGKSPFTGYQSWLLVIFVMHICVLLFPYFPYLLAIHWLSCSVHNCCALSFREWLKIKLRKSHHLLPVLCCFLCPRSQGPWLSFDLWLITWLIMVFPNVNSLPFCPLYYKLDEHQTMGIPVGSTWLNKLEK